DAAAVERGLENLEKHVENMRKFNVCPVVAINHFASDSEEEVAAIKARCKALGVKAAVARVHAEGGKGGEELARMVSEVAEACTCELKPLYDWNWEVERKIETIAREIYGAAAIDYTPQARADLKKIAALKLEHLPVCIAKTQKSLSDNPKLLGRPENFVVTVREIEIAAGAGFIIPITGNIMRMPGLPAEPAAEQININDEGKITGLF
ncbi:MAG TPA: formate--tetrahydrofolate ligase, partial [Bacteroidales bacterium]|nr:formate--tetrahydrofolate ligase [Bacteroidales bacterium]